MQMKNFASEQQLDTVIQQEINLSYNKPPTSLMLIYPTCWNHKTWWKQINQNYKAITVFL